MGYRLNVIQYIYNRSSVLESEYYSKLDHFRYHRADEVDYLEIIIAKARNDLMKEISQDLNNLLAIKGK